jgi:hypothetical protein
VSNIVTVEANNILNTSVSGTAYPAVVKPVNLALITTTTPSTATAAGSEVTGGSYARQDTTTTTIWGSASGGTITNSATPGTVSFTNMPACTIGGIELWDTATRVTSADGVTTNTSPNVSAADGNFTSADVGQKISGTGIPSNTTISSVTDSTHVVMSANATASSSTVTLTIVTPVRRWFGTLTANKTVNSGDTVTFAQNSISITLS